MIASRLIKALVNLLCLILIFLLPGSGIIIVLFIHDKALLMNVLRGRRNIIIVLKETLHETYKRYINSKG